MAEEGGLAFGSFRFDARTGQLWRDDGEVKLTPRAAAVLHTLAKRPQELVTKQDLFDGVWGGMATSDDALTSAIQELRGALGDNARRPRIIETRHRRGYRLMVPATPIVDRLGAGPHARKPSALVGRASELDVLSNRLAQALSDQRQIVFITGEPGIGKSALAEAFAEQLAVDRKVRIAQGQCLDHHGV